MGRDHDQLLHPAADPGRPGPVADHRATRASSSTEAIQSLYVLFGLDKKQSLWEQYVDYWDQLLHGDLGLSFTFFPTPVSEVHRASAAVDARPGRHHHRASASCSAPASACCAGWRRGSWVDGLLPVTTFLSSIPYFWLGLIAIALLAGPGSFFPSSGGYDPGLVPALGPGLHRQRDPAQPAARR